MRLLCYSTIVLLVAVAAQAENRSPTLRGVATVVEVDHDDGRPPERIVTLRDRDGVTGPPGRALRLRAAAPAVAPARSPRVGSALAESPVPVGNAALEGLVSGQLVEVAGSVDGDLLTLDAEQAQPLTVLAAPVSTPLAMPASSQTIVILGNFQNKALDCTLPEVDGIVFSDADAMGAMLSEASYGDLVLGGVTVGTYTIPFDSTSYAFEAWDDALRDAATLDGVDLSGYAHHIYVLPSNSLSSSGLGTVGVDPIDLVTKAWIFNCDRPGTYAHEFGHNLTLSHAGRYFADTGVVQSQGDASDNMGSQIELRHYNGPHKLRLGWVPEAKVRDIEQDGSYTLRRLWDTGAGKQLLRIRNVDPTIAPFFDTEFYYVSYRPALGFDANLPANMHDAVFVHETSSAAATTYLREWLDVDETFEEPVTSFSNVSVRVISKDGLTATVEVLGVPPPVPSLVPRGLAALTAVLLAAGAWRQRRRAA